MISRPVEADSGTPSTNRGARFFQKLTSVYVQPPPDSRVTLFAWGSQNLDAPPKFIDDPSRLGEDSFDKLLRGSLLKLVVSSRICAVFKSFLVQTIAL